MTDDLYHARIVALARAATGGGELAPPAGTATVDNPLCGDRVRVDVVVSDGRVEALAHRVRGCLLCEASAAVLGAAAPGETVEAVRAVASDLERMLTENAAAPAGRWADLGAYAPVTRHPSRHGCERLPFQAVLEALGD